MVVAPVGVRVMVGGAAAGVCASGGVVGVTLRVNSMSFRHLLLHQLAHEGIISNSAVNLLTD